MSNNPQPELTGQDQVYDDLVRGHLRQQQFIELTSMKEMDQHRIMIMVTHLALFAVSIAAPVIHTHYVMTRAIGRENLPVFCALLPAVIEDCLD